MNPVLRFIIGVIIFFIILIGTFKTIVIGCRDIGQAVTGVVFIPCFMLAVVGFMFYMITTDDDNY